MTGRSILLDTYKSISHCQLNRWHRPKTGDQVQRLDKWSTCSISVEWKREWTMNATMVKVFLSLIRLIFSAFFLSNLIYVNERSLIDLCWSSTEESPRCHFSRIFLFSFSWVFLFSIRLTWLCFAVFFFLIQRNICLTFSRFLLETFLLLLLLSFIQ